MNVPGSGTLTLGGGGVVSQRAARLSGAVLSRSVSAAGKVSLLVKAKGKTKKKLNRTGKAKVKVNFTPTGGASNTQTKTVKLVKKKKP